MGIGDGGDGGTRTGEGESIFGGGRGGDSGCADAESLDLREVELLRALGRGGDGRAGEEDSAPDWKIFLSSHPLSSFVETRREERLVPSACRSLARVRATRQRGTHVLLAPADLARRGFFDFILGLAFFYEDRLRGSTLRGGCCRLC